MREEDGAIAFARLPGPVRGLSAGDAAADAAMHAELPVWWRPVRPLLRRHLLPQAAGEAAGKADGLRGHLPAQDTRRADLKIANTPQPLLPFFT